MDPPSPPSSASSSEQLRLQRPFLPCIQILRMHFNNGGLTEKGYNILYRMIEMTSAIGWETHVIFCSKIPHSSSLMNMERFCYCILEGCRVFRRNMKVAISKAMDATDFLPELNMHGPSPEAVLKLWKSKLSDLHRPTGNDVRLFESMLNHFEDAAYNRVVQLDIRKPKYNLEHIVELVKSVYIALEGLRHLAQQADELVRALDQQFQMAVDYAAERQSQQETSAQQPDSADADIDHGSPVVVDEEPLHTTDTGTSNFHLSKSFSFAEEEIVRRGHARAATFSGANYSTLDLGAGLVTSEKRQLGQGVTLGVRRKGTNVPRIFTGSFSQLESELRKLRLDKVETPVTQNIDDPVKVRDFGATPEISPCTTHSSQPLQRREAFVSRDTEFQDRVIKGEVVKTRRPSNKSRMQMIEDKNDRLEAWLEQKPLREVGTDTADTKVRRGSLRQRDNTI